MGLGFECTPGRWGRLVRNDPGGDVDGAENRLVPLTKMRVVIGRDPDSSSLARDPEVQTVRILNQRLSAEHCILEVVKLGGDGRPPLVKLQDLSKNGTWVNGQPVGRLNMLTLARGDTINLIHKGARDQRLSFLVDLTPPAVQGSTRDEFDALYALSSGEHSPLGSGAFSTVSRGTHRATGHQVAVKRVDKRRFWMDERHRQQVMGEVEALKKVSHPSIVRVLDVFNGADHFSIVLELCEGGDLFERVSSRGPMPEPEAQAIFRGLLQAVAHLHDVGIVHRDIKPENILFPDREPSSTRVKVADFGLARLVDKARQASTLCGTPQYVAPEIVRQTGRVGEVEAWGGYGVEVDMWSLGVVLYFMLSGYLPWRAEDGDEMYGEIARGDIDFPDSLFRGVSAQAKELVRALLRIDPRTRLTAHAALSHAWMGAGAGGRHMPPPMLTPKRRRPTPPEDEEASKRLVTTDSLTERMRDTTIQQPDGQAPRQEE